MSVCLWVLWMLSWQNYFPFRKGNTEVLGWKWTDCIFFSYLAWEAQAGLWKQHSQGEYWHTSPDAISYLCGSVIYVGLNAYAQSCYCCLVMSSLGSVWKCTFFFSFFGHGWVNCKLQWLIALNRCWLAIHCAPGADSANDFDRLGFCFWDSYLINTDPRTMAN